MTKNILGFRAPQYKFCGTIEYKLISIDSELYIKATTFEGTSLLFHIDSKNTWELFLDTLHTQALKDSLNRLNNN